MAQARPGAPPAGRAVVSYDAHGPRRLLVLRRGLINELRSRSWWLSSVGCSSCGAAWQNATVSGAAQPLRSRTDERSVATLEPSARRLTSHTSGTTDGPSGAAAAAGEEEPDVAWPPPNSVARAAERCSGGRRLKLWLPD